LPFGTNGRLLSFESRRFLLITNILMVSCNQKIQIRDVNAEIGDVNAETRNLHAEIGDVNAEIGDVNAEIGNVNAEFGVQKI